MKREAGKSKQPQNASPHSGKTCRQNPCTELYVHEDGKDFSVFLNHGHLGSENGVACIGVSDGVPWHKFHVVPVQRKRANIFSFTVMSKQEVWGRRMIGL